MQRETKSDSAGKISKDNGRRYAGTGQLSIVEHALCPLDSGSSLQKNLVHEYEYLFTDKDGRTRTASAQLVCPGGLSAADEFYLWGLLGLTFAQAEAELEFHATPHFCLRQLGLIDQHSRRGGRQYRQFAEAVERLSLVTYRNDGFYDPTRGEHRKVSFGFLSYSLPIDPDSSRAWRIAWDPLFFDLVRPVGGHLAFDLNTYRELDPASRRLFMLVSKIFRRRLSTPRFDVRHLAVNVLGFSPSVATRDLKVKVRRCVTKLTERQVVAAPFTPDIFEKVGKKGCSLQLNRGGYFERRNPMVMKKLHLGSPMCEPLRAIGFDDASIARLVSEYPAQLLRQWIDITLAAKERRGLKFFKKSPQAYFVDNVRNAAQGRRTPPDWWHDLRKTENGLKAECPRQRHDCPVAIRRELPLGDVNEREELARKLLTHFRSAGQSCQAAKRNAQRFVEEYARRRDERE